VVLFDFGISLDRYMVPLLFAHKSSLEGYYDGLHFHRNLNVEVGFGHFLAYWVTFWVYTLFEPFYVYKGIRS